MKNTDNIFNIIYNKEVPAPGKLLLADPFLTGYPFCRSVVLLVSHTIENSMVLIINVPLIQTLNELIPELEHLEEIPLFRGGPLGEEVLFFIHTYPDIEGAFPLTKNLYFNGNFDQVKQLLAERKLDPNQFKFFLGYSGWGDSQLEEELKANSWIITEAPALYLIHQRYDLLWQELLKSMGGKYKLWARYPLIPSLN